MQLKDYFKLEWKRPTLNSEEITKEQQKDLLTSLLDSVYSRMESVEILNSNAKSIDALVIMDLLLIDLFNICAEYKKFHPAKESKEIQSRLASLPDNLANIFKDKKELLDISTLERNEKNAEICEEQIAMVLTGIEKFLRVIRKSELHTTLDDVKKKWRIQITSVVSIIGLIIGSIIYQKVKYPNFEDGKAQIFLLSEQSPVAIEANSSTAKVLKANKGEWVDYSFEFTQPMSFTSVRIDPIDQRRMKFSIAEITILGDKDRLLFKRDFVLNENFLIKDYSNIGEMNDLKAGKAKPGGFVEMVSTGSNPFFVLNTKGIANATKVLLKTRITEERYKFKD